MTFKAERPPPPKDQLNMAAEDRGDFLLTGYVCSVYYFRFCSPKGRNLKKMRENRHEPKKTLSLHVRIAGIILILLFLNIPNLFSQERTKIARVSRTDSPPKIDGLIEDASWIADTGRWNEVLKNPSVLKEVEPYPSGEVIVGRGSVIDVCKWDHPLPRDVK